MGEDLFDGLLLKLGTPVEKLPEGPGEVEILTVVGKDGIVLRLG